MMRKEIGYATSDDVILHKRCVAILGMLFVVLELLHTFIIDPRPRIYLALRPVFNLQPCPAGTGRILQTLQTRG